MAHQILYADPEGVGAKYGLQSGDTVISINGEEVLDEIDYQALTSEEDLDIVVRDTHGRLRHVRIIKDEYEGLGLRMSESMVCTPRTCMNKCIFCFVDQMPEGMRSTLYVKDDDWRMSLMMGNFITLTNVDDKEFDRIIRRHATPLYISVQTTNMELRKKMLHNRFAGNLLERLGILRKNGIRFHCQVVLCPGINDGPELEKTIGDLYALYPAAMSVALVPVGLTRFRDGLYPLTVYDRETARTVMDTAARWQKKCFEETGSRFVFPADEFYCITGDPIPADEAYEGYPQLENGVGMLRQFEDLMKESAAEETGTARARKVTIACGTSLAPVMSRWMASYAPQGITWKVKPIRNDFFGPTVTVSGLLTGRDLAAQLRDEDADEIMISGCCLREEGDLFLDDMSLEELKKSLPCKLTVVNGSGDAVFKALMG